LIKRTSSKQITEWMAFFSLEEEERVQRELQIKAEEGVRNLKARRRR
jgi:hypothetical protein